MNLIPKTFELGGSNYTVVSTDKRPEGISSSTCAHVIYSKNLIEIFNNHIGYEAADDYKTLSYYHEITHAILRAMGRDDLNDDESFVETFSNFLHQIMKTSKFE